MSSDGAKKVIHESLLELAKSDREVLITRLGSIQARTGFILAGSGLISAIVPALITDKRILYLNWYLTSGIIFSIVTVFASIIVLWGDGLTRMPKVKEFFKENQSKTDQEVCELLLVCLHLADTENNKKLEQKVIFQNISLVTFAISTTLLFVGSLLQH